MKKVDSVTKTMAVIGAILVWVPLLLPVFFSAVSLISDGVFRFDYLMPAELFPAVLAGGLLLLWVAFRARMHQRLVGWALAGAVILLVVSQGVAVVSGLASGEIDATGGWFALVVSLMGLFNLAVIGVAVGGLLLLRDLFNTPKQTQ